MTKGAGFSVSSIESSKENRNLRKIRPRSSNQDGISRAKNMEKADIKSISESINYRTTRSTSSSKSGYFFILMVILIIVWIFWTLLF